jgi:hypothetical protein
MKTIMVLLTPILIGILIYFIAAFIGNDFDVMNFKGIVRFFMVMMWIASSAFGIMCVLYN